MFASHCLSSARARTAASVVAGSLFLASRAESQTPDGARPAPEQFGERGQLVLPNLLGYSFPGTFGHTVAISHSDQETLDGTRFRRSMVAVQPSVDYFVGKRWSLGATLLLSHVADDYESVDPEFPSTSVRTNQASLIPRVGYAAPLAPSVTFWPQVGAGAFASVDDSDQQGGGVVFAIDLPVVFDLGRYVFVTAGLGARAAISRNDPTSPMALERYRSLDAGGTTSLGVVFGR